MKNFKHVEVIFQTLFNVEELNVYVKKKILPTQFASSKGNNFVPEAVKAFKAKVLSLMLYSAPTALEIVQAKFATVMFHVHCCIPMLSQIAITVGF